MPILLTSVYAFLTWPWLWIHVDTEYHGNAYLFYACPSESLSLSVLTLSSYCAD